MLHGSSETTPRRINYLLQYQQLRKVRAQGLLVNNGGKLIGIMNCEIIINLQT